ncbi:MAG: ADP-forming succinate--CoA ligase subunit beta [Candidatus Omnitrophica bacterium]|nr:ADP-forming succinate--CoA ligase subunit beta [Candidatus Omnitrophota bacterium]
MRLLEYQAKKYLASWGVTIPREAVLFRPAQMASAVKKVGPYPVVLKVQVFAGGRGKAGGVVKVKNLSDAKETAKELLSKRLVTAQTGPDGVPVKAILVEQGVTILKEYYLSILIDRSKGLPLVVAAREGGVTIEELARENPSAILKTTFDPLTGLIPFQARRIVSWLKIPAPQQPAAVRDLLNLAKGFFDLNASLVEVNPWALTQEHGMVALDAKITVDDNAIDRRPELLKLKTADADSPMEARSRRIGINYVALDGTIGCMVNGAGLAMATMDLIQLHGGRPANFLDVGGGADVNQVREAFKLILADKKVKAVLVNIFGGIMKCDVIAQGIIQAARLIRIRVPLVVRLEGTNVEAGRKMLEESGLGFITAAELDKAAEAAVRAAQTSVKPETGLNGISPRGKKR